MISWQRDSDYAASLGAALIVLVTALGEGQDDIQLIGCKDRLREQLPASAKPIDLSAIPLAAHEAMRLAIVAAQGNPASPFGAVIIRAADRQVLATGVNKGADNPTFHGEIVAINDYVARNGNSGWREAILTRPANLARYA